MIEQNALDGESPKNAAHPIFFWLVGAILGGYFAYLMTLSTFTAWMVLFPSLFALFFLLAPRLAHARQRYVVFSSAASAGLATLAVAWAGKDHPIASYHLTILGAFAVYMIGIFHMQFQRGRLWRPVYSELFIDVWDTAAACKIAMVFTFVMWLVLWLWAALFGLAGEDWFFDLFADKHFIAFATVLLLCIGLGIAVHSRVAVRYLRHTVVTICTYTLLLLSVALLLFWGFRVVLLVSGGKGVFDLPDLWLAVDMLAIILINAAYQDGEKQDYHTVFKLLVPVFVLSAVLFPLLSLKTLWLSSDVEAIDGDLQVYRLSATVASVILLCYNSCYAVACVRARTAWFSQVRRCNIIIAWLWIAAALLLNNPLTASFHL